MPTPSHHPPAPLLGRAFTTDDASAAGLTRGQLSGRAYVSEGRSLWSCAEHPAPEVAAGHVSPLALPAQEVTPGAVISHVTAAQVLGLRLPARLRSSAAVHLTQTAGRKAPRRAGVVGHRARLNTEDIVMRAGMVITGPARTVVDLAGMARGRGRPLLSGDDLLVLLEGIIDEHTTGPRAGLGCLRSREAVAVDLAGMTRVRGVMRVRQELDRALPAVDSALETRMRLMLEAHGLGGWVTDLELTPPGHRRVWPDLADEQHRLALQIEGPHHDGPDQRLRDIERERATAAAGWREIRLSWKDMRQGGSGTVPEAVRLIRAARAESRASRPHLRR